MISSHAVEVGVGKSKSQHGLLLALLCTIAGLGVAFLAAETVPSRDWVAAILVGLGVGVGVHAWRRGRDSSPHLRIDDDGIWFREWGVTVPWREVGRVYAAGSRVQTFVAIRIADPERFVSSLPPGQARRLRGHRLWKSPELRIPNGALAMSHGELLTALQSAAAEHA